MPGLDIVVLGDVNPDLLFAGERIEPAFGQAELREDDARQAIERGPVS